MDDSSFDQLARRAAAEPSRRAALRFALASLLASLGAVMPAPVQARAKKKKSGRRQRILPGAPDASS